jgi:hypothetical protein
MKRNFKKNPIRKTDPEFRFLLNIDPDFEEWRAFAAEWLTRQKGSKPLRQKVLAKFFISYLHGLQLNKSAKTLLDKNKSLPSLWKVMNFHLVRPQVSRMNHDHISDFVDMVLKEKFSEVNSDGFRVVPPNLHNPFPRMRRKISGKSSDASFMFVVEQDSRMEDWRTLASEWLRSQRSASDAKREAIARFFSGYVLEQDLDRNPYTFLRRDYAKPTFINSFIRGKRKVNDRDKSDKSSDIDVRLNNHFYDFIDWVLTEKLYVKDDNGQRFVPHQYHNPVVRLEKRQNRNTETQKISLAYCYIRELRKMIVQGPNFSDWDWAQHAMESGNRGGDWFLTTPSMIKTSDPDCVWRNRHTTKYEQETLGYPPDVFELWSPVRAVALYLKLELPLRTFQVRMLDSGEADTWRYESLKWHLNCSPFANGSERRPFQRGVFHRSTNEVGAGFYINTNKTSDINKDEQDKGYVIPWTHEPALYWLEKLRNWQEAYNPITSPTPWRDLDRMHFGRMPPHPAVLEELGASCFLFRDATADNILNRDKPFSSNGLDRIWYLLLAELEKRCQARGETLDGASQIRFIEPDSNKCTHYPLHALRVSLITSYALDGGVPFPILSKLIAGHARLIMTLYYTKAGKAHVTEVMQEADKRLLESEAMGYRRFLMEKTYQEIEERFAFNNTDALKTVSQQKSAANLMFEDKGICPVGGGLCDIGGDILRGQKTGLAEIVYGPVSGYPQERKCIRCRFFLTGPAFLPGLQAHANWVSHNVSECSERYVRFEQQVKVLEDSRQACEENGKIFTLHQELERLNRFFEEEAERANKLLTDLQAVVRLIDRCISIANYTDNNGVRLVATGNISDIKYALCETESEMHQLEVLCKDAVIFPELDGRWVTLRRSQILDTMLQMNGRPPVFFQLNQEQQLLVGNEIMTLIQSRTGSLKNAVEFAEGKRLLVECGLLDETIGLIEEKTAGVAFRQIIKVARSQYLLTNFNSGQEDSYEP